MLFPVFKYKQLTLLHYCIILFTFKLRFIDKTYCNVNVITYR